MESNALMEPTTAPASAASDPDVDALRAFHERGDGAALSGIFSRHADGAYRVALAVTANAADAEDAVQTAFLHILRAKPAFEPRSDSSVRGWIMRIVVNAARGSHRSENRRRHREELVAAGQSASAISEDPAGRELHEQVARSVKGLPERYRLPIWLYYFEHLSFDEIGRTLDVPEKTAREQARRGIDILRQELAGRGVAVTAAVLPAMLAAAPLETAPATLLAAIGGMTSNAAVAASAAPHAAAAKASFTAKLIAALLLTTASVAGAVTLLKNDTAEPAAARSQGSEAEPSAPVAGPEKPQAATGPLLGSTEFSPSPERPVGWRGDGTGRFPGATPPIQWSRRIAGPLSEIRSSVHKPKSDAPDPEGIEIVKGAILNWLVAGPVSVSDAQKAIDEELVPGETALQPQEGDKFGEKPWRAVRKTGANQWSSGLMTKVGQNSPPKGYNFFGDEAPREKSSNVAGMLASYIYSPSDCKLMVEIGDHHEGLKVWLNGAVLYASPRANGPNHRATKDVTFRKGWNTMLVKTAHAAGGWDFVLKLKALEPVRYTGKNIRWMTPTPGSSCAQPVLVGDRLYFTSSDRNGGCELLCANKSDGKILWLQSSTWFDALNGEGRKRYPQADASLLAKLEETSASVKASDARLLAALNALISPDGLPLEDDPRVRALRQLVAERSKSYEEIAKGMKDLDKDTFAFASNDWGWANPVPCCDGKALYVYYATGITTAFDLNGKRLWIHHERAGAPHHGDHVSPSVIDGKFVYHLSIAGERKTAELVGLDCASGKELWRTKLRSQYAVGGSTIPGRIGGEAVVVEPSGEVARASDGTILCQVPIGSGQCSTPILAEGNLFADSCEYLRRVKLPERVTGPFTPAIDRFEGEFAYIPSPLFDQGKLYRAHCYDSELWINDAASGKMLQKVPLNFHVRTSYIFEPGVCASPTLAGKYIYVTDNNGTTLVLDPAKNCAAIAENIMDGMSNSSGNSNVNDQTISNPVFEGSRMYYRNLSYIFCVGE